MKVENILFIHSHIFFEHGGQFYSDGKLKYEAWERYLEHCNYLTVLGRSRKIDEAEINQYDLSSGNNVSHFSMPNISSINRLKRIKEVKKILKKHIFKSDLVVVRLPSEYGNIALKEATKLGIPYAIEVVGDVYLSYKNHGNPIAQLLAPVMAKNTKKAIDSSEYVLYVTKEYLQNMYPSSNLKITTACSNVMIDNRIFEIDSIDRKAEEFTIGLIGSYRAKYKGIEDALQAIKQLKDKGIVCHFRILGSGNKNSLENLARELNIMDQITFDGTLPAGEAVWNWIKNLDLYIQPNHTEGFPRALIEAMSCGIPCIASNVGGIPELLHKEDMHNPKDVDKLAYLIEEFSKKEARRMGNMNRNLIKSKEYVDDVLRKKRYDFFSQVISDIKGENEK